MDHQSLSSIAYLLLHSADYLLELLAAVLLFIYRKKQPDRSRFFLSAFFMASLVGSIIGSALRIVNPMDQTDSSPLLDPIQVLVGFPIFFLLLLYLAECMRPYYMNGRRILIALTPWLLCCITTWIIGRIGMTPLHSLADIGNHTNQADVWIRLAMLMLYLPFGLWVCTLPYQWRETTADKKYVVKMSIIAMIMTITYIGGHGLRLWVFDIAHVVLYVVITLNTLFYEFLRRPQPLPGDDLFRGQKPLANPTPVETDSLGLDAPRQAVVEVKNRLEILMNTDKVWQDPDLTMEKLIMKTATNSLYLLQAIRLMGYKNYSDMINHMRVAYIREWMDQHPDEPLMNIFYDAGYRSRTSAWRNFTNIVGQSPTEYRGK